MGNLREKKGGGSLPHQLRFNDGPELPQFLAVRIMTHPPFHFSLIRAKGFEIPGTDISGNVDANNKPDAPRIEFKDLPKGSENIEAGVQTSSLGRVGFIDAHDSQAGIDFLVGADNVFPGNDVFHGIPPNRNWGKEASPLNKEKIPA
jgi:hypothetical protein